MSLKHYTIGIVLILLYFLPVAIFGEGSHLIIHDNMDGEFIQRFIINGQPQDQLNVIPQIFNGLPSEMISTSQWGVTTWLFDLFSPFTAYIINDFSARIIGFVSMMLLLNLLINNQSRLRPYIIIACSLTFAFIGSYTIYNGLTVLGQPLILWIFIKIYREEARWWAYLLIAIFTLWSSFVLSGIFICMTLGVWWLVMVIRDKKWHWSFFLGLSIMSICYILVEHKILLSFLSESIVSHRTEFLLREISLKGMVNLYLLKATFITQYHAGVIYTLPIILTVGLKFWLFKRMEKRELLLIVIIAVIILIGFIYQFLAMELGGKIKLLNAFQWDRFYFLLPMLWIILLGLTASKLMQLSKTLPRIAAVFLMCLSFIGVSYANTELRYNYYTLFGQSVDQPSYSEFFDVELFNRISEHIGTDKSQYRVVSLGMFPSVTQYNDFYTLDSYQVSYPLSYKHQFREIIASELDKSLDLRLYFDNWGSRCYIFSNELGNQYMIGKNSGIELNELNLNTDKLYEMGARYLFSAVEIKNYADMSLTFDGEFEGKFWKIYLYQIRSKNE